MYKTELHLHSRVSVCCDCPPEIGGAKYREAGYRTVVVTDHMSPYFCHTKEGSWEELVRHYFSGADLYRPYMDGITILTGMELRLPGSHNDYLVYGLTPDFLLAHRDLCDLDLHQTTALVHEAGGLIYQAHPFRDRMMIVNPEELDGIEVFNGHNRQMSRNPLASLYAEMHGKKGIAGTDFHHEYNVPASGILTEAPILSNADLLAVLKSGDYQAFGEIVG